MFLSKNALLVGFIVFLLSPFLAAQERITVQGSTTVLPIMQILAEAYLEKDPEVDISVSGGGSGVGITALLDGVADIAMSSREAKGNEIKDAQNRGKELIPFIIAYDAIALIVHPSNPLNDITLQDLQRIYGGEVKSWAEVGGQNIPVVPISRDFASGTFEVFNRVVLSQKELTPSALMLVSNLAILQEVASSPGCIGYVGLGYVQKDVKVLSLDGIFPSPENVRLKKYPLARALYLYLSHPPEGKVQNFLEFILSEEGQKLVAEEGFIPVNLEEKEGNLVVSKGDDDEKSRGSGEKIF
ncbi:MAG: phosphate ABC transporter substrate-binding protein [Candidatus Caldatribacteriaceae bacterium]